MIPPFYPRLKMILEYAISINIAAFTITITGRATDPNGGSPDSC